MRSPSGHRKRRLRASATELARGGRKWWPARHLRPEPAIWGHAWPENSDLAFIWLHGAWKVLFQTQWECWLVLVNFVSDKIRYSWELVRPVTCSAKLQSGGNETPL